MSSTSDLLFPSSPSCSRRQLSCTYFPTHQSPLAARQLPFHLTVSFLTICHSLAISPRHAGLRRSNSSSYVSNSLISSRVAVASVLPWGFNSLVSSPSPFVYSVPSCWAWSDFVGSGGSSPSLSRGFNPYLKSLFFCSLGRDLCRCTRHPFLLAAASHLPEVDRG